MAALGVLIGTVLPLRQQYGDDGRVLAACELVERLYEGRDHWTGVSLSEHTAGVLTMLLPFQPDAHTIIACLLQHVLHTKQMPLDEVEGQFGAAVRSLVSSVHLLSHVTTRNRRSSIEDLRLMLLSVSDDVRVLLIILCERSFVLDHLDGIAPAERRRLCRDVLGLFAPVAARLGIHSLKQRLENRAFPVVYPHEAELVGQQRQLMQGRFGDFLPKASKVLTEELAKVGIVAEIDGREKQIYSIFTKLKAKSITSIDKLHDLFALRVRVQTAEECYRVLGVLHQLGRPVANRFKDYIAFPKPNGYQSLHTTIARLPGAPDGIFIEVQIRTHAMHREAEYGIAAHWSYKEGGTAEHAVRRVQLQQVLTRQQPMEGGGKAQHLVDHMFVLTPKGDIIELPEGATPLDFAFQIHTHLGLTFRAARVNGVIVPLDYGLENGDVIEILSHRIPKPSSEWMQLLKMASSRSRLKRYIYAQNRADYVVRGREIFNEELRRQGRPPLDTDLMLLRSDGNQTLSFSEREDLLMKVGQGSEKASAVLAQFAPVVPVIQPRLAPIARTKSRIVEVEGGVPMPLRYAKCCKPDEGTRSGIVGFITRTGEVSVHREKCKMMRNGNPDRRVNVRWKDAGVKRAKMKVR